MTIRDNAEELALIAQEIGADHTGLGTGVGVPRVGGESRRRVHALVSPLCPGSEKH